MWCLGIAVLRFFFPNGSSDLLVSSSLMRLLRGACSHACSELVSAQMFENVTNYQRQLLTDEQLSFLPFDAVTSHVSSKASSFLKSKARSQSPLHATSAR